MSDDKILNPFRSVPIVLHCRVRSGWSIKTDHTFGMPGPLTDKERSMILEVVQKADRVERMEQERIVYVL